MNNPQTKKKWQGLTKPLDGLLKTGQGDELFRDAVIVGLLLTFIAIVTYLLPQIGDTTSALILCSGLGIILGAFGSTATVKYKGIIVTGVGALAISLLVLVHTLIRDEYAEIRITGDVDNEGVVNVEVQSGKNNFLGAYRSRGYSFIVKRQELETDKLIVAIIMEDESEKLLDCVPEEYIKPYFGRKEIAEWRYDDNKEELFIVSGGERNVIATNACGSAESAVVASNRNSGGFMKAVSGLEGLLPAAYAQSVADTSELLKAMESSSAFRRRDARAELSSQGANSIPAILEAYRDEEISYRKELGVLVAMAALVRNDRMTSEVFKEQLQQKDFDHLVRNVTGTDSTISIYATNVLRSIKDPRMVEPIELQMHEADPRAQKYLMSLLWEKRKAEESVSATTKIPIVKSAREVDSSTANVSESGLSAIREVAIVVEATSEEEPQAASASSEVPENLELEVAVVVAETEAPPVYTRNNIDPEDAAIDDDAVGVTGEVAQIDPPDPDDQGWVVLGSFLQADNAAEFARLVKSEDPEIGVAVIKISPDNRYFRIVVSRRFAKDQSDAEIESVLRLETLGAYGHRPFFLASGS